MAAEAANPPGAHAPEAPVTNTTTAGVAAGIAALPPLMLAAALLGGIIAAAQFDGSRDSLLIVAIAALVSGAWWVLWRGMAETDWAAVFATWRTWEAGGPIPALPYTAPGSLSDKTSVRLGHFRHWLRHELLPAQAANLFALACALAVAVVMGAALGAQALALTLAACVLIQAALLIYRGHGVPRSSALANLVLVTLPFLLGFAVLRPLTLDAASGSAAAVGLCAALFAARARGPQHIGYGAVLLLLLGMRHTVGALIIGVLWLPLLLLPGLRTGRWWPVLALLASAIALS
jgi:hypothetical protein